jgi:hypothetical protein
MANKRPPVILIVDDDPFLRMLAVELVGENETAIENNLNMRHLWPSSRSEPMSLVNIEFHRAVIAHLQ